MATPATPSRIKVTAVSRTAIDIFWSSSGENTTYYLLERSADGGVTWAQINKLPSYQTLYHDTGLSEGASYCYRVRGSNAEENGPYSDVACTPTVTHTILSTTHRDTTPATLQRGDLLLAMGTPASLRRYGKGSQYQVFTGGVDEPTWGAVALDQATALSGVGLDGELAYASGDALAFLPNADGYLKNTSGVLSWEPLSAAGCWSLTGNAGTDPDTDFLGTTDDQDVVFKRNGVEAFRIGKSSSYGA